LKRKEDELGGYANGDSGGNLNRAPEGGKKWRAIAVAAGWLAAGIVALCQGHTFALMVALLATAMMFFIEDAIAAR